MRATAKVHNDRSYEWINYDNLGYQYTKGLTPIKALTLNLTPPTCSPFTKQLKEAEKPVKVLTPSIKPYLPYKFLWAYGSSWRMYASLVGKGLIYNRPYIGDTNTQIRITMSSPILFAV